MQSLCNVIKGTVVGTDVEIKTKVEKKASKEGFEQGRELLDRKAAEAERKNMQESMENIGRAIISRAQVDATKIIEEATLEAERIKQEAYNNAYKLGQEQGYNDGYKESYEKGMVQVQEAHLKVKSEAEELIVHCKNECDEFLISKDNEIKSLIKEVCKNILKREVKDKDSVDKMILTMLKEIKESEKIIIKCNRQYIESIKENLKSWQEELTYRADMFVIPDDDMELGNVIIEKDGGIVQADISKGMEKFEEILKQHKIVSGEEDV